MGNTPACISKPNTVRFETPGQTLAVIWRLRAKHGNINMHELVARSEREYCQDIFC